MNLDQFITNCQSEESPQHPYRSQILFKICNKAANGLRGQIGDALLMRTRKHSVTSHYAHVLMGLRCAVVQPNFGSQMNKKQLLIDFSWGLVIVLAALFASYLRDSGYTDGDAVTRVVMCLSGLMVASFGNRVPQFILPQNKISFFRQIASKSLVFGGIVFAGLWAIAEISIASSVGIVVLVTAFIFTLFHILTILIPALNKKKM